MDDEVKLMVDNKEISGWTSINVRAGIEVFPTQFTLSLSEVYPNELAALRVEPGAYCELWSGKYTLVRGYVDRYHTSMSAGAHSIQMSGRGKCQDMMDCSAEWPGGQFSDVNAYTLAKNLAAAYGKSPDGKPLHPINVLCNEDEATLRIVKQLNLMIGESAYEVIERVCRYSSLLLYEDFDGDLILSRTGTDAMASGLREGVNVQAATIEYGADLRFSQYAAFIQSIANSLDGGDGGNLIGGSIDTGVKRNRKRYIVAEATQGFQELCIERAIWERNHRNGKSEVIKVVTDTWFDEAGRLWKPNNLIDVFLPSLKMKKPVTWLIGDVVFNKDSERGTTAELTIMNPKSFAVQPMALEQSNLIDTSKLFVNGNAPYWDVQ
jgi:prophage tail gpP-like protein